MLLGHFFVISFSHSERFVLCPALVVLATASILVLPYVLLQSLDLGLSYAAYISHPRLRFDVSIFLIAPLICFFVLFRCFVVSSFLLLSCGHY